ncbi:SDR family oxidoreductase [Celeribacter arenosi]|uniref:SDR family oxidoreductase n=1 Tax=Celeribacter arenosi TaxID=792649 RepID=A0ABP7JXW1_9RHOB
MSPPHLLSLGHGYSAQALSRHLIPAGWKVTGTTRRDDKAARLMDEGVSPILLPRDALGNFDPPVTHLLISAGPDEYGDPMLRDFNEEIAGLAPNLVWMGYLSTTGVYGDHGGGWVDETTPLTPATQRGLARVSAENEWQTFASKHDLPLAIFRLAGIYGPGRGPFAKVRNGTARRIIKAGQVFSRIHVEDIANTLLASINRPQSTGLFNVCDDDPAPPQDVISYAAMLLNLPEPAAVDFETADMTPMARSFYAESKKVSNARIKTELGVQLRYPDFKTGLRALLDQE